MILLADEMSKLRHYMGITEPDEDLLASACTLYSNEDTSLAIEYYSQSLADTVVRTIQ
jgi:hypothetical protein